jgi:DNA polymerase-3 subunit gamma/tau
MSQFVVSARKYRPTTFDEVIGQNHIARTLKNALATDQLAHAFLFCGPRGVGKTTCARILAKVLNCENLQDTATPCNQCSSCVSFNNNASFNIIELDAASNNSVNDMRNLIEQVRFQPQQGKYKIFIIDEVHMLSTQAFNAFLKTLEEPPSYGIFILATTEKHKIIPTILSRCQIFDFKRIQEEDIVSQLQDITLKEGRKAQNEALHIIAQKADGAMRDALSIYDKIASASTEEITYKDVIDNLNILDYDYYFRLVDAFLKQDLPQVLLILEETVSKGFDVEQTAQGLSEHLRDLMVCKHPETLPLLKATDALKQRYVNQANLASTSMLTSALNILNQADIHFPRAKNKRLHFEMALIKINYIAQRLSTGLIEEKKTKVLSKSDEVSVETQLAAVETTPASKNESASVEASSTNHSDLQASNTYFEEKEARIPDSSNQVESDNEPRKDASKQALSKGKVLINRDTGRSSSVLNTPRISSTASLIEQIKEIEAEQEELKKNLNSETIQKIWSEHANNNPSPSVRNALQLAILEHEGKTVKLTVPSVFTKDIIVQEQSLLEKMRTSTGTPDLKFDITISKDAFPDYEDVKPKKLLTNKEKYELMRDKNPKIDRLRDTFSLEVDTRS